MIAVVGRLLDRDGDLAGIPARVAAAVAPAVAVRWAVVSVEGRRLTIEAAVWDRRPDTIANPAVLKPGSGQGTRRSCRPSASANAPTAASPAPWGPAPGNRAFIAVQILPTGIGLETGGFAGDGTPATNLLAAAADQVVTHPNAVNAAALNWAAPNVLYVEGALLDAWLAGAIALRPVRANRIGLLVDRAIDRDDARLVNAANAFRRVGGGALDMAETAEPLDLRLTAGPSGATGGTLGNPEVLLAGARRLVAAGADAIALVADFRDLPAASADYLAGRGPDPVGGLEAILSHLVALELGVPCAHAPWIAPSADPCDPRAAAEELGTTYLLSVLRGLGRAPRPVPAAAAEPGDLAGPDVVVAPEGAMGGPGVLAAAARGVPVIAVENPSVMAVRAADLGIAALPARSYAEAAGLVLALRAGVDAVDLVLAKRNAFAFATGVSSGLPGTGMPSAAMGED